MNQRIRQRSLVGFAALLHLARCHDTKPSREARRLSSNLFIESDPVTAADLFAHWTAEKIRSAIPLDLKIDPRSGEGFVVTDGEKGLVSYADLFAAGMQTLDERGAVPAQDHNGGGGANVVRLDAIFHRENFHEKLEARNEEKKKKKELRGRNPHNQRSLEDGHGVYTLDLASIEFKNEISRNQSQKHEERRLRAADTFVTLKDKPSKKDKKEKIKQDEEDTNEDDSVIKTKDDGGKQKKKKFLPAISDLRPSRGTKVLSSQTFSARIRPSSATVANIREVSFRLVDPGGQSSDWLPVPSSGAEDLYEITIEGFEAYPSSKWRYQIMAMDDEGWTVESSNIMFRVDGNAGSDLESAADDLTDNATDESDGPSGGNSAELMDLGVVGDSNWPYGGGIQSATGRILFEFNGSGTYVCSGTVVQDGDIQGRSVILTAAHCAYNDSMKKFATKAIFIPDQVGTRGLKSDFNCANDKYGCWELSFAVVYNGWAFNSFPENVEYDYAFYVVLDGVGAHSKGFLGGLSGTLDIDTVPMYIDFESNPEKDFAVALGYSANHDPAFRYCTNDISTIKGVPWYTNLWIDQCGMTGGASGGPWAVKMDTSGVGTIVSVNSWGFTDKIGMAGPQLRTSSGSLAECLFEKAKYSNDPGRDGGYIVDC
ncbi:hypothetical protein ACHAWX_002145 [Stephanocyclus meneghinianus]